VDGMVNSIDVDSLFACSWASNFSSDVTGKTITEEEQDYKANLSDIAQRFTLGKGKFVSGVF